MTEQEDVGRKMKQQYLKEQIGIYGWDMHEFAEFLAGKRENGRLTRHRH